MFLGKRIYVIGGDYRAVLMFCKVSNTINRVKK